MVLYLIGALSDSTPVILCHKEPARRNQSPLQGAFEGKITPLGSILLAPRCFFMAWRKRIVGFHARKGPIVLIYYSRQWEWCLYLPYRIPPIPSGWAPVPALSSVWTSTPSTLTWSSPPGTSDTPASQLYYIGPKKTSRNTYFMPYI